MRQSRQAVSRWRLAFVQPAALALLQIPLQADAQSAPFTLSQPAANARAITVDKSAAVSSVSTIVPRLFGPPPPKRLHDSNTGAAVEEFGTAYSYANPLFGTAHLHENEVGGQQASGAAQSALMQFVVARFGAPPPKLPPIAGIDLAADQPDVPLVRFALQPDRDHFPDTASVDVLDRALHGMGRARVTQIDIVIGPPALGGPQRQSLLRRVALALVHQGAHPATILADGIRILPPSATEPGGPVPGHVFSLVLLAGG